MKRKIVAIILTCISAFGFTSCGTKGKLLSGYEAGNDMINKNIKQVDLMPEKPRNYKYTDYGEIAKGLDGVLYKFAENTDYVKTDLNTFAPIGYWIPTASNIYYKGRGFGIPSYVGHVDANGQGSIGFENGGSPEGITVLGSIWGSTVAGIDKSNQQFTGADGKSYTYNFVDMAKQFYSNEGFILNRIGGTTGNTFWYEVYPQIQFARIMNMYEMDASSKAIILKSADNWVGALKKFTDKGNGRFHYTSFDFFNNKPVLGMWAEPVNGGAAFLLINAYNLTKNEKYINAAKEYLDYVEKDIRNPNYEILSDYLPYAAAYLNFIGKGNYNIEKFVNFLFDAEDDCRPTGIVNDDMWGKFDANGLMSYDNWNNNYDGQWAFAMNSFHLAAVLAPMLRYDTRYADDVGKWFVNAVNSARIFYSDTLDNDHKTAPREIAGDPEHYIAYEGTSKFKRYSTSSGDKWDKSVSPYAMGDPTMRGWGKTDFGIYGSGHSGLLSLAKETNVDMLLQVDITKTDDFAAKGDFQQYLYYNPHGEAKSVDIELGKDKYLLFDTVTNSVIKTSASGKTSFNVPSKSSVILALIPQKAEYERKDGKLIVDGIALTKLNDIAVSITSHTVPRKTVSAKETFQMSYSAYKGDSINRMVIYFNDNKLYDGMPKNSHEINFSAIPLTDYTLVAGTVQEGGRWIDSATKQITYKKNIYEGVVRVEIYSEKGCYDVGTIRVRK